jgi:hypothetical protein
MTATNKGIFSVNTHDPYVPRPSKGQQHVRFGNTGVGATTESYSDDYHSVPDQDEVQIRGQDVSREQEERNLIELKSLARQLAHEEGVKSVGPCHNSRAAIAESALGKYATAIGQTRLTNPSELTRDLPHVENVDIAELHRRLVDEAKHRQAIETHASEIQPRGGIAAHVQSAADKIAQVIEHEGEKLPQAENLAQTKTRLPNDDDEGDAANRVLRIVPTDAGMGETNEDESHRKTNRDERISREHEDRRLAQLHAAAKRYWEEEYKSGMLGDGRSQAALAESAFREYATAIAKERGEDVEKMVDTLPPAPPISDGELLEELQEEAKARQSVELNIYGGQGPEDPAAHVQSAIGKFRELIETDLVSKAR